MIVNVITVYSNVTYNKKYQYGIVVAVTLYKIYFYVLYTQ